MTIFAPYCYNWSAGNSVYKIGSLMDGVAKIGLRSATSCFTIGDGFGNVWQTSLDSIADQKSFVDAGNLLILSFGGASGPYLEQNMTEDQMFNAIDNLLTKTGSRFLDFDVEGSGIGM